jgi:hypothetical protein
MTARESTPYLSVVVTTRNDDHGGDPLKRLQAFVNCFDEQCRRTGLSAELIVVEWNPPADKPRVSALLDLPAPSHCTYRFIEVPPELHARLKYSDVLPLFQMIGKNVGIRRAQGRFVLATNIDIIFSNALIEWIAAGRLEPGRMYRVDRHDIESDFPVTAPLETQMAYADSHHLRIHERWGSFPTDPSGVYVAGSTDIVDGTSVRLGRGWHVREGVVETREIYRWVSSGSTLLLDSDRARATPVLDLEIESNPFDPQASIDLDVLEDGRVLASSHVEGLARLAVRMPETQATGWREVELRAKRPVPQPPAGLPVFERRQGLDFRVRRARLRNPEPAEGARFEYPVAGWENAHTYSRTQLKAVTDGLEVATDPQHLSYAIEYGPLQAPQDGLYRFHLRCSVTAGGIAPGVLSGDRTRWLKAAVSRESNGARLSLEIAVDLKCGESFWLVVSNNHPGYGVSTFTVHSLEGSCDPSATMTDPWRRVQSKRAATRSLRARLSDALKTESDFFEFPSTGWESANTPSQMHLAWVPDGVEVSTDPRESCYAVQYTRLKAPHDGLYRFHVLCTVLEGGLTLGILSEDRAQWLHNESRVQKEGAQSRYEIAVDLKAGDSFWVLLSNNYPGRGASKFVVHRLTGSCEPGLMMSADRWRELMSTPGVRRSLRSRLSDALRGDIAARVPAGVRRFVTLRNDAFTSIERELETAQEQLRTAWDVSHLKDLDQFLRTHRPAPIHGNGCGDFHLMAREHWEELRAYPEFETFSMNIDGLFSYIAVATGITEEILAAPIYHIEHEVGSGWSPEGEAKLRKRIAESGITWLDATTVHVWASYMRWLNRPMIFNNADWGFAACDLPERVVAPSRHSI